MCYLFRSLSESKVTSTLIPSGRVGTCSVPTDPGVGGTLVGVHTDEPGRVEDVPGGTLAAERAVCIDTAASLAHIRTDLAFVQVLRKNLRNEDRNSFWTDYSTGRAT